MKNINNSIRPFESGQLWFLDTSRDVESYSVTTGGGTITDIGINAGANGRPDVADVLIVMGVMSTTPDPVTGGGDTNDLVEQVLQNAMVASLDALFEGVNVDFTFTAPGTFPNESTVPYSSIDFSQICIAGAPAGTPEGVLGAAIFDPNNETQEDNCQTDFQGFRLGVFAHTLARIGYISGATSTFRTTYTALTPSLGGTPIGNDGDDAARLIDLRDGTDDHPDDGRETLIANAINRLARSLSVVTAHECGHSMGLVKNGPMPGGVYGNDPVNFPLSPGLDPGAADTHIQNDSLFPTGAQNVMSPAIDFEASLSDDTGFNTLNKAYLRERVLYDN